jgi:hypothetical protein
VKGPEHKLEPMVVERGGLRIKASCSCGGWYRSADNHDGGAQKRLAEKFLDHKREWR